MVHGATSTLRDLAPLAATIKAWGRELGFQAVGIADAAEGTAEARLADWLASGFHGEMEYMARHGAVRARPAELVPGTVRVITARMDYRPDAADSEAVLADGAKAFVSRYALGRDYHKVLRARLQRLADRIAAEVGGFGYRVFTDSAPVMEVELAARAGLGWRGKHTLLLAREAGSLFFLGEIYTDLPLPADAPVGALAPARSGRHLPTGAIVALFRLTRAGAFPI
jgi:epoxyqueuosine reductase